MYGRSLLLLFLIFISNYSQSQTVDVTSCTVITDGEERLRCYDDAAGLKGPDVAESIPGGGNWEVSIDTDALTDARRVTLVLEPTSGGNSLLSQRALLIRCNNGETDLFIAWSDYIADGTEVTIRVGDLSPSTRTWTNSTNNTATFFPGNPVPLLLQMLDHTSFVARATPYSESPVTLIFDTTGMAEAIAPLRETCGW